MRRKDLCWSVRAVYILEKRSDVSGPDLWYRSRLSLFHGRVCHSCAGMVRMAGVDLEWSHNMAHALALDTRSWLEIDRRGRRSLNGVRM
jgi:hypothetical protein